MEGASWVAKKAQQESDRHHDKVTSLVREFETRTQASVNDEKINDYDGRKVAANKQWMANELQMEGNDLKLRFDHLFENVNF
jgi:hypothetical protein